MCNISISPVVFFELIDVSFDEVVSRCQGIRFYFPTQIVFISLTCSAHSKCWILDSFLANSAEDGTNFFTSQLTICSEYHKCEVAAKDNHDKFAE